RLQFFAPMRVLTINVALAGLLALSITGCGAKETPAAAPPAPVPTETAPVADLIDADGWSDMVLTANYAETKVDIYGHFETSRNACGRESYGAFDKKTWNDVANAMNEVSKLPKGEKK